MKIFSVNSVDKKRGKRKLPSMICALPAFLCSGSMFDMDAVNFVRLAARHLIVLFEYVSHVGHSKFTCIYCRLDILAANYGSSKFFSF